MDFFSRIWCDVIEPTSAAFAAACPGVCEEACCAFPPEPIVRPAPILGGTDALALFEEGGALAGAAPSERPSPWKLALDLPKQLPMTVEMSGAKAGEKRQEKSGLVMLVV